MRHNRALHLRRGGLGLAFHLATVATVGIVFPFDRLAAAAGPPSELPAERSPIASIMDMRLADGGTLNGQIVDDLGRPWPGLAVVVYREGHVVGTAATDPNGEFSIAALRGGVHEVGTPNAACLVRLWVPGTAPPSAITRLMLVSSGTTVRGQRPPGPLGRGYERLKCWLADPLVVAGIVAVAVAIPVAIHNADQDRDSGS